MSIEPRTFFLIFHVIGVALGVGGATVSDIMFLRAMFKKKPSFYDYDTIKILSRVVWTGVAILLVSGSGLLYSQYLNVGSIPLLQSPRFLTKLTLVAVVITNGLVFHSKVFPCVKRMCKGEEVPRQRLWLFSITGAISGTTWYSIIVLSLWRSLDFSYPEFIGIYLLIVAGGITTARLMLGRILKT